jgi:FtsP/CotA-like multicopper oxidase with cupredoxin domain
MIKWLLLTLFSATYFLPSDSPPERALINDNLKPAGLLRNGVLTLRLEARVIKWYPETDNGPNVEVQGFAEVGKRAQIPGPLIRVPVGTRVDVSMHNAVPNRTLVVHGLSPDSIIVESDRTQRATFKLNTPGTYYYWGTTSGRGLGNRLHEDSQLTGAIVVDTSPRTSRDRILVIGMMGDTFGSENLHRPREHLLFVINGRTWPHTERLSYHMGDTIRWHVLNTTTDPHPMHLHGTYYRVESHGDGIRDTAVAADQRPLVNTALLTPGSTMTMSWTPEHPGNWLFHCHIPEHFGVRGPLGTLLTSSRRSMHSVRNHALEGMSGLVMGVTVHSKNPALAMPNDSNRRRIRLLVRANAGSTAAEPYYGFSLNENGPEPAVDSGPHPGPPLILVRGQPVGIMVVNRTDEATAIHWHGIELESYFDGVAGFSGIEQRLTPVIAPRDSFEARFVPPRAGTFMYHTHVDERRQQLAGLAGMLLVLEPGHAFDPARDIPILITSPSDSAAEARSVLVNGSLTPTPLELRAGVKYRLRFANITIARPGLRVEMLRDSLLSTWTPIAKDGADLPISLRVLTPARQRVSIGETADFEVTPAAPGDMRLDMKTSTGALLGRLVIHVR